MYKLTFQDQSTASLIKLNNQFVLAQPELSQEAHAALCLFLPNEAKADNQPEPLTPQAFCDYRRGDEVEYAALHLVNKALGVVTSTAKDSLRVIFYAGQTLTITKPELIKPTGERMENLYHKGARVVFQAGQLQGQEGIIDYPTSSTSYSVNISDKDKVDYPAEHLKLAEVILPHIKDANNKLGVQVKTQFTVGDEVLIRLPDNSVTKSHVIEVPDRERNLVKCQWQDDYAYFYPEQLTRIKPEDERRGELEYVESGDKLLVVVGEDVTGNARREGSLFLGDIVTFDRWVPSEGHMLVKLRERAALHPATIFQQTE